MEMETFCCICNVRLNQFSDLKICNKCLHDAEDHIFNAAIEEELDNIIDPEPESNGESPGTADNGAQGADNSPITEDEDDFEADIYSFLECEVLDDLGLCSDNSLNLNLSDWPILQSLLVLLKQQHEDTQ
ncbi:hypothetical protein KR093_000762 [Drosophila rubida]|uniref:Uncharacterized protein n=1 Tax=Drosophila rubida TaxID=30044 RepID=A0AAD4KAN7_9MUSC|nr:hypothetical protein KR093_000762 [Drosophila rubida]